MAISTIPNKHEQRTKDQSLFADLDRHRRRKIGWNSCGCLMFVGLLVVLGGAVAAVAATGIITIPWVSSVVYDPAPTPVRLVDPSPFDITKLLTASSTDTTVTAHISEGQLTSLVSADRLTMFRQAEFMADPAGLTFFGRYTGQPIGNPAIVQLTLVPTISNLGSIDCAVTKLSIGRLSVPPALIKSLGPLLCSNLTSSIVPPHMKLVSLVLGAGQLLLTYKPNLP